MNVLFITCATLFPCNSGYKQSVVGRIWEAVQAGVSVHVIELSNESRVAGAPRQIPSELASVSFTAMTNRATPSLSELRNLFSKTPRYARIFATTEFCKETLKVLADFKPDVIYAESAWAMGVLPENCWHKVRLVVHDVLMHFFSEAIRGERSMLRKIFFGLDALRIATYERKLANKFQGQWIFLTSEDLEYYVSKYRLDHRYTGLASNKLMVKSLRRQVNRREPFLLFAGSIDFHQNFTALKWFLDGVWSRILSESGSCLRLVVTGSASPKRRALLAEYPGIIWSGEVMSAELDRLYASCVCCISPIVSGTGLKIKNLEAVSKGIPVVGTRRSARGIVSPLCHSASDDSKDAFYDVLKPCVKATLTSCHE